MDREQQVPEETKQKLKELSLMNLQVTGEHLDLLREQIKSLDETYFGMPDILDGKALQLRQLRRIYEYMMLIGLISSDLWVAYRVYLRAEDGYEVQYANKQIVIILIEGFKQVYNFVNRNDKGDLINSKRNKSIWKKDIGDIVIGRFPDLVQAYQALTADLESFDDGILKSMHKPRNIFVHYDHEPSLAYDELVSLHIEHVTRKAIPFMALLKGMMEFNLSLTGAYVEYSIKAVKDAFVENQGILEGMKAEYPDNPAALAELDKGLKNLARMKREYHVKELMRNVD